MACIRILLLTPVLSKPILDLCVLISSFFLILLFPPSLLLPTSSFVSFSSFLLFDIGIKGIPTTYTQQSHIRLFACDSSSSQIWKYNNGVIQNSGMFYFPPSLPLVPLSFFFLLFSFLFLLSFSLSSFSFFFSFCLLHTL